MLYRYITLKTDEQFLWFTDLLVTGKVFFPKASRFNDPNEFRFQLRVPDDKAVIKAGWQKDHPEGSEADFESWYGSTSFKSWHVSLEPLWHKEFRQSFGLMCFSELPNNPTMWAHYADNHQGVCVGFDDLSIDSFPGIQLSGKVDYQEALPIVKYFGEDPKEMIYKIFFTKCSDWRYEREYRLVAEADASLKMDPILIKEVVLGWDIDPKVAERVREIVATRQNPIPVRKAQLSYMAYEMEIH